MYPDKNKRYEREAILDKMLKVLEEEEKELSEKISLIRQEKKLLNEIEYFEEKENE
jgi:hypothetical protein